MRLFAIFILLPQILHIQSMFMVKGYENNEYKEQVNGYTKRWASLYDGYQIYNASELIQLIHPRQRLSPSNCVVESQFVWGHYDTNNQTFIDVVIQFRVNPSLASTQYVKMFTLPPWPAQSYPYKPRTRIANSLTVTGTTIDKQYCRTTWRLINPTAMTQYYQLQYNVGLPVPLGNCFDGFMVGPMRTSDVVCRYMDLAWVYNYRELVASKYPWDGTAEGPYYTFIVAVPPYEVKHLGVSSSYIQPPIPTRKAILDYLEAGFFDPQR